MERRILDKKKLALLWSRIRGLVHGQAFDIMAWECSELQHIFALLLLGSCVGIPSSPVHITFELLPYLEDELFLLLEKTDLAAGPLSELFSHLNVG